MKAWLKTSPVLAHDFPEGVPARGCYFGGGGGGGQPSGQTTTVQKSDPWAGQQPYLTGTGPGGTQAPPASDATGVFPAAQAFYSGGNTGFDPKNAPQYFGGQTVAQLNPTQLQAIQAEQNMALGNIPGAMGWPIGGDAQTMGFASGPSWDPATGQTYGPGANGNVAPGNWQPGEPLPSQSMGGGASPSIGKATNSAATNILSGANASAGNPYFQGMAQDVLSSVVPAMEGTFNQGNRLNSPGAAYATAHGAAQALAPLAYQNYSDQLNNQVKALALAPQVQGMNYQNVAALSDAGGQVRGQDQANIDAAIQKWNYEQQLPLQMFNQYANSVQGGYGSTSTLSQPYYQNTSGNLLGGALGGGLLGGMLGPSLGIGSGYGAAGGAGLGSLAALALA